MTIKAGQKLIIKWKAGDNPRPVDKFNRRLKAAVASEDHPVTLKGFRRPIPPLGLMVVGLVRSSSVLFGIQSGA